MTVKTRSQSTTLEDFQSDNEDDEWGMFRQWREWRCTECGEIHESKEPLTKSQALKKFFCHPGGDFKSVGEGVVPEK